MLIAAFEEDSEEDAEENHREVPHGEEHGCLHGTPDQFSNNSTPDKSAHYYKAH
jgi:hypothetical protein